MKLTPAQQKFCTCVVSGMNLSDSYRKAFPKSLKWKDNTVNSRASELAKVSEVAGRIEELRKPIIEKAQLTRQWVIDSLITVAQRCMQVEPVLDKKGDPILVKTDLGELSAAFTFEPAGANKSLELLGKEVGMFVERRSNIPPEDLADKDALQRRIQERQVKLGLAAMPANVVPIKKDVG